MKNIFTIIIAIIVGLAIGAGAVKYFDNNKSVEIDDVYRAVFLDNNQVYFAKIKEMSKKYVTVYDVYYFGKDKERNDGNGNDDIVLVKLGSEVHGPTDEMQILESHILYIEKLGEDSRVVKAIKEHKAAQ